MTEGNGVSYTTKELLKEVQDEMRSEFKEINSRLRMLEDRNVAIRAVERYRRTFTTIGLTVLSSGVGAIVAKVVT